jgi:hypothetical protein
MHQLQVLHLLSCSLMPVAALDVCIDDCLRSHMYAGAAVMPCAVVLQRAA